MSRNLQIQETFGGSLIIECTKAGLAQPNEKATTSVVALPVWSTDRARARKLIAGGESPRDVAKTLNVARSMLYLHLAR